MIDAFRELLGIQNDAQRVMAVTQRLSGGRVRVESGQGYLIVSGDYALGTQLIISGGNVVGVVGKSAGTFEI